MHVTMIKKRLRDGSACKKCIQAEDLLRARGLWPRIDEVIWADEADPDSGGMKLARRHQIETAPFFVIRDAQGQERVYTSSLEFIRKGLGAGAPDRASPEAGSRGSEPLGSDDITKLTATFESAAPQTLVRWALERYGAECGIAFSGAEDVVLIEMAKQTGLPFSVFTLDTGRLHPETYRFIDKVRAHYGIVIDVVFPNAVSVQDLVRHKGLFSFYEDGHGECCGIRKVEPLARALAPYRAWLSGQRRDQSPTRSELAPLELDAAHAGKAGALVKVNPLCGWSLAELWGYVRDNGVPYNELHDRGFVSIGCEPCTRAIRPGEHERAGRWWWEEATKRECGLHR